MDEDAEPEPLSTAIVLAEDKKYYPSADEVRRVATRRRRCGGGAARRAAADAARPAAQVYGKGTETLVMDEDAQTLEARARLAHATARAPPPENRVSPLSRLRV